MFRGNIVVCLRRAALPEERVWPAHAAQANRTILSFDAKARFSELPGVAADEP